MRKICFLTCCICFYRNGLWMKTGCVVMWVIQTQLLEMISWWIILTQQQHLPDESTIEHLKKCSKLYAIYIIKINFFDINIFLDTILLLWVTIKDLFSRKLIFTLKIKFHLLSYPINKWICTSFNHIRSSVTMDYGSSGCLFIFYQNFNFNTFY